MYKIQANPTGTRHIDVNDEHLKTIKDHSLFQLLTDSNGIIDESVLEKLKLNIRSLLVAENVNNKELLDLCIDVIYNQNMKAFGLRQLIDLYNKWDKENDTQQQQDTQEQ